MQVRSVLAQFPAARSGASAVEFALVAPLLLTMLLGVLAYGVVLSTYNSVQQLAAEAARASVGGLDATERDSLARAYVAQSLPAYAMLDQRKLTVSTSAQTTSFQVTVAYDMSTSPVFTLGKIIPMPSSTIRRSAAVQNGGY